jgi:tRNA pseudouridine38-40 synthase
MRNVRLVIEYDGGRFSGWQSQARPDVRTVQEELEAVLSRVLRERVLLTVAGRTDTGVHAEGQVANFRTASDVPLSRLARALAGLLPSDVTVRGLAVVPPSFHARHSAVERRYAYRLLDAPAATWAGRAWWPWTRFDPATMTAAFAPLLGEHDFRSFAGKSPETEPGAHGRCRVRQLEFTPWERGVIFRVHANRFLYHMVRNLVGTAVAISRGRIAAASLGEVLASRDRRRAGPTAPPDGLTLTGVLYPAHCAPIGEVVDGWGREIA